MQRKRDDVEKSLGKKGFENVTGKGKARDHRFYRYHFNGSPIDEITTHVSTGTNHKSIAAPLLARMAQQCKLTNKEFIELIDCTLSHDEYNKLLQNKGLVPSEDVEVKDVPG